MLYDLQMSVADKGIKCQIGTMCGFHAIADGIRHLFIRHGW